MDENQWSNNWAYSMAPGTMYSTQQQMNTRGFIDGLVEDAIETVTDNPVVNEVTDVVGDTIDFVQDPSLGDAVEIVAPAVVEDVFNGGGLDDFGFLPKPIEDIVDGDGYQVPFGPTIGPNAPQNNPQPTQPTQPTQPVQACPRGFRANPYYNPNAAMLRAAGSTVNTRADNACVPDTTPSTGGGTGDGTAPSVGGGTGGGTGGMFDENCNEKPKDYPAPGGCIPQTGSENQFFSQQRKGCQAEWKALATMEEEIKARYEQLCIAKEKYNQRQDRYGGVCGPYELLYGIEEQKEKLAREKDKAKRECLSKKQKQSGGTGCGCMPKTSTGCGCGCSGKTEHSHSEEMEYEYTDPAKTSCKRAVEESFKPVKKARVATRRTPARAAKSSCMKSVAKKKRSSVRKLRKPKNTTVTLPKCGKRKTRS